MNTTLSVLKRAAPAVLVAVVAVSSVASPAGALDLDDTVTLPIGWGPVIVGLVVSVLTHLATRANARPWVRVLIATVLSAVTAIALQLQSAGWAFVPSDLAATFLIVWVTQLLMHLGLVKPVEQSPAGAALLPDRGLS